MAHRLHDFYVKLAANGAKYTSFVQDSPAGQDQGPFLPPIQRAELEPLHQDLGAAILASGSRRDLRAEGEPPAAGYQPKAFGKKLGKGLFTRRVKQLYARSLGAIQSNPQEGLRLSIHFNLDDPGIVWLGQLPWELIHDGRRFLLLDPRHSLVRCLDLPEPPSPVDIELPLKVLVVLATPRGTPSLDAESEYRTLVELLNKIPSVEVKLLAKATPQELGRLVQREAFHVIHFIGHADFNAESGEGRFLLETDTGGPNPVEAEQLANLLRGGATPQLLVLNACRTASFSWQHGRDPWSGLATALLVAGFPVVVAMQFPITDKAAVAFSRGFYGDLAAGKPVDIAVTGGRREIFQENHRSLEWATPVQFGRGMQRGGPPPFQPGPEPERPWDPVITFLLGILGNILAAKLQDDLLWDVLTLPRIATLLFLTMIFLRWSLFTRIRRRIGSKPVIAFLAACAALLVLFSLSAMFVGPRPDCDGLQISRVELDLPTAPPLSLNLSGDHVTDVKEQDLQGIQRLSGRAVFSNPDAHCPYKWSGKTDQRQDLADLESSADCNFTIDLPAQFSRIYLRLEVGDEMYLFTVRVQ